jgi:hypothetical protein
MPRPGSVKSMPDVRSLARSHTALAINTLAGIARSPKCPPAARVTAAIALLDRGYGRPPQEHSGEDGGEIRVTIRQIVRRAGELVDVTEGQVIEHDDREPPTDRVRLTAR